MTISQPGDCKWLLPLASSAICCLTSLQGDRQGSHCLSDRCRNTVMHFLLCHLPFASPTQPQVPLLSWRPTAVLQVLADAVPSEERRPAHQDQAGSRCCLPKRWQQIPLFSVQCPGPHPRTAFLHLVRFPPSRRLLDLHWTAPQFLHCQQQKSWRRKTLCPMYVPLL